MTIPTHDLSAAGLSRRQFIAAALALAAGGLLPDALVAGAVPDSAARLTDVLGDLAAAGRLGRAYLADRPDEADAGQLVRQVRLALEARSGPPPTGRDELAEALTALVQDEYVTAALVPTDGWLLAPTEARLYALAALADTPAGPY